MRLHDGRLIPTLEFPHRIGDSHRGFVGLSAR